MPLPSSAAAPSALSEIIVFLSCSEDEKAEKAYVHDLIVHHVNPELRAYYHTISVFDSLKHTFVAPGKGATIVNGYIDELKKSHLCLVFVGTTWMGIGTFQELDEALKQAKSTGPEPLLTTIFKKIGEPDPKDPPVDLPEGKKHMSDVISFIRNRVVWHNYTLGDPTSDDYYKSTLANHTWKIILRLLHQRLNKGATL